jgi:orotidine-5'-phosphate decarboxylase
MTRKPEPPVCIALDTPDVDEALRWVDTHIGVVPVFKVGATLFTSVGPRAVEAVRERGADVFLDLKLADIPRQVEGAVRAAARLGTAYLTVHGNAGRQTIRAAVEAAAKTDLTILVVTVLTSLDGTDLEELGVQRAVSDQVDAVAELAVTEGARGLVLGAAEIARVRSAHPELFLLMPGLRPAGSVTGDQKRVGTPGAAIRDGADMVVVGRAVTEADDPRAALDGVLREIDQARGRSTSKAGA